VLPHVLPDGRPNLIAGHATLQFVDREADDTGLGAQTQALREAHDAPFVRIAILPPWG